MYVFDKDWNSYHCIISEMIKQGAGSEKNRDDYFSITGCACFIQVLFIIFLFYCIILYYISKERTLFIQPVLMIDVVRN
jgi:heme/copper-type cytochrome/quinol oxidase subunit 2